jgi:hypothetical protein
MKMYLVFYDWLGPDGESVYFSEAGVHLTNSDFHHGTCFEAELTLDESEEADLVEALEVGFTPVFTVSLPKEGPPACWYEVPPKERLTARGHQHGEAFCLMTYVCEDCGHREIIWNSRDGVTPMGCPCPRCDHGSMWHSSWESMCYAPGHTPHKGQGVWIDMPESFKPVIARMRTASFEGTEEERAALIEAIIEDLQPGTPWLFRWP